MSIIITRNKQLQHEDTWNENNLLINNEQLNQAPLNRGVPGNQPSLPQDQSLATFFSLEGRTFLVIAMLIANDIAWAALCQKPW